MASAVLENLLVRLRQLQRRGGVPVGSIDASDWYEVNLFPPASEGEIRNAEKALGKRLPEDFVEFLRFSNGANLFVNDSGLHGVGVASTELLVDLEREEAEFYELPDLAPYSVFARVNGAGDFLVFDLAGGRVLDGVHAERPHEWRPIAESFTDWLSRLTDAGGAYYWIEALYDGATG